jgi:hypothetical protein
MGRRNMLKIVGIRGLCFAAQIASRPDRAVEGGVQDREQLNREYDIQAGSPRSVWTLSITHQQPAAMIGGCPTSTHMQSQGHTPRSFYHLVPH